MEEVIKAIVNNPFAAALIASPIGLIVLGAIYQAMIKIMLSDKNIDNLAKAIDDLVDKMQKKSPEAGKLTRSKVIATCEDIIKNLKDATDGVN